MKGLFLLFIVFLLSACPSKPYVVTHTEEKFSEESVAIYVVSHGWHTGIVVPAREIQSTIPQLKQRFKNTPYLEFGWGDNKYYPADETTTGLTLRAILWPTGTVIHAVAVPEKVDLFFPDSHIEELCLDGTEYSLLICFLRNSFYKNEENNIIELKKGNYGNSQFYQGEGVFYFMNTCNNWTAKGLKSAGMDISPAFKLTSNSVMDYLVKYNQALKNASNGQNDSASPCR